MKHQEFTVSYPRPDQVLLGSLSAAPRCDGGQKERSLTAVPTIPSGESGRCAGRGFLLFLECALERIIDGSSVDGLIVGKVVAVAVLKMALSREDRDENKRESMPRR